MFPSKNPGMESKKHDSMVTKEERTIVHQSATITTTVLGRWSSLPEYDLSSFKHFTMNDTWSYQKGIKAQNRYPYMLR